MAIHQKRKVEWLKARRTNVHILLDKVYSVSFVVRALLLDYDLISSYRRAFEEKGMASSYLMEYPEHDGHLTAEAKVQFRCIRRTTRTRFGRPMGLVTPIRHDQTDNTERLRTDQTGAAAKASRSGGSERFNWEL